MDRGCQDSTTLSVEYSREGLNADGANPSEAVLGIWACNIPVREHQASAVCACNVPVREHQASGARCESEPTVSRLVSPSLFGEKSEEADLTAPEGAGGSKLLLLEERCDSSVGYGNSVQLIGQEAVASPSLNVGSSRCFTGTDAA